MSYQRFEFDKVDGISLTSVPAVFRHEVESCDYNSSAVDTGNATECLSNSQFRYTNSVIATTNRLSLKLNQVTLVATYGVNERFDLSVAVPVPSVSMGLTSTARIYNVPNIPNIPAQPGDSACKLEHTFAGTTDPAACLNHTFPAFGTATGIGDITLRGKVRAFQGEKTSLSVGVDVRIPTGDALNFLGAGTWGIRPFGTYSASLGIVSPHATIAIQGNGQSVLAGDVTGLSTQNASTVSGSGGIDASISKSHLPDALNYAGGIDITIHHRLGASVDYLGQTLFNATRVRTATYAGYTDFNPSWRDAFHSVPAQPDLATYSANITLQNISAGIKVNLFRNLIVTGNGLFRLNDAGLHAKPSPLVGLSYTF